jgi:plastocyanin
MKVRLVLPLVAIALAACGGSSTAPPPPHLAGISITNSGFSPVVDTVQTNTRITWTVTSGDQHHVIRFTVPAPTGSDPNSSDLSLGQTASTTFLQTGTFEYEDTLHTANTGTVVVQ